MQGWQHIVNDILNITGRSVLMFFLTLAAVRFMGKRSIGELAPFDLAVVIIMGSVAALPLEEENIHILHGIVPIVVLATLQTLLSVISMHWRGFEKVTQGVSRPIVVNGQVLRGNLQRERVSDADLHIMLRNAGVERVEDVALAVLEPTGELSVMLKKEAQPVTLKDMDLMTLSRLDTIREQLRRRLEGRYSDVSGTAKRTYSRGKRTIP
ncbi:MAG: DUF421 domain-containing protein [Bacillota bacterium]